MLSLFDSVVIGDEYEFRGDWDKCIVGSFPSVVLILDAVSVDVSKVLDFVSSVVDVTIGVVVIIFLKLVVGGIVDVVDCVVVFVVVVVFDINTSAVEAFKGSTVDGNSVDVGIVLFVNVDFVERALETVVLTVDAVVLVFVVVDRVDVVLVLNVVPTFNTFNVSSNPFEVSLSSFDMNVTISRYPLPIM